MEPALKTLNDFYPNILLGEGIFSYMTDVPWISDISGEDMDIMFFSEYGQKPAAPIFNLLPKENNILSEAGRQKLAELLQKRFKYNWIRKYNILKLDYNPLDSYKMQTTGTDKEVSDRTRDVDDKLIVDSSVNKTNTGTDSLSENKTDETTYNSTVTTQGTSGVTGDNSQTNEGNSTDNLHIFGFNSSTESPTNKNTNQNTSSVTQNTKSDTTVNSSDKKTGSDTNEVTGTNTRTLDLSENQTRDETNTRTIGLTQNDSTTLTHDTLRSGALGIFTNQDVLQKEIDLWKWNFFKSVFDDVSQVITLAIYRIEI